MITSLRFYASPTASSHYRNEIFKTIWEFDSRMHTGITPQFFKSFFRSCQIWDFYSVLYSLPVYFVTDEDLRDHYADFQRHSITYLFPLYQLLFDIVTYQLEDYYRYTKSIPDFDNECNGPSQLGEGVPSFTEFERYNVGEREDRTLDQIVDALCENPRCEQTSPFTEYLGLYFPYGGRYTSPAIFIRVDKTHDLYPDMSPLGTLEVLLHEFGHAIMDNLNCAHLVNDPFYYLNEEALANGYTLCALRSHQIKESSLILRTIVAHMELQPFAYALGTQFGKMSNADLIKCMGEWIFWKDRAPVTPPSNWFQFIRRLNWPLDPITLRNEFEAIIKV